MAEYFIKPTSTSGTGTEANPWGIPDLLNTTTAPVSQGPALTTLKKGDTLLFNGGDYHISGTPGNSYYANQLIGPTVSGTASEPITLSAIPGQTVRIFNDSGGQPTMGCMTPKLDYVRFLGFTLEKPPLYTINGITLACKNLLLSGVGCEAAYNEIIGDYVDTTDNHNAVRIDDANGTWFHHNFIHGVMGPESHSTAFEVYNSNNLIIEDNYATDCMVGFCDKSWGQFVAPAAGEHNDNTYRRNWLTNNVNEQFIGNNQLAPHRARYFIYDNILDGAIPFQLNGLGENHEIYNNLIRNLSTAPGTRFIVNNGITLVAAAAGVGYEIYQNHFWNNVCFSGDGSSVVLYFTNDPYTKSGSTAPIGFSDYNIFDGAPQWAFKGASVLYDFAKFKAEGFDANSSVVPSQATVYPGIASGDYTLAPAYKTAGRYGDEVGPRSSSPVGRDDVMTPCSVAEIMNPARYGPAAMSDSGGGTPPPKPSGAVTIKLTLTPSDGAGGTFKPGSVVQEFTYTPAK